MPAQFDKKTGLHKGHGQRCKTGGYYIPGHGRKIAGKYAAERIAKNGHPRAKPIGSTFIEDGYIYEKCPDKVWRRQHRILKGVSDPKIFVHHKNQNRSDNSDDNLEVMWCGDHTSLHCKLPSDRWAHEYEQCTACGTTDREHHSAGLCMRCYQRKRLGCTPRKGLWATGLSCCISCGTTRSKHRGKGLCAACYSRKWKLEHR